MAGLENGGGERFAIILHAKGFAYSRSIQEAGLILFVAGYLKPLYGLLKAQRYGCW